MRSVIFTDLSKLQKLLIALDFVNFGGFRGFRFLDPPHSATETVVTCMMRCDSCCTVVFEAEKTQLKSGYSVHC